MSESSRVFSPGRLSSGALYALIVLAPVLGGSSSLETLAGLSAWTLATALLVLFSTRAGGRQLAFPFFAAGLVGFSLLSAAQAMSLPMSALEWLSPRAHEIRSFVLPASTHGAISYEVGASWREAAKLLLYAGVFVIAAHRARARQGVFSIATSVLVAGLAVMATAFVHRVLGTDRVFGVVDSLVPMTQSYTTFSNPNHAAGFLSLAAFCGLGLALPARTVMARSVFGVGAGACLLGSLVAFSRAGMMATALAGVLLLVLLSRGPSSLRPISVRALWVGAGVVAVASVVIAFILWTPELGREIEGAQEGKVLGLTAKLAAVQDAIPMTFEHAWFGIGRGAYASLYTLYKTSTIQLTFAFPENIAAQFLSEWGVVFGGIALFGLLFGLVVRLLRADSPVTLSIMAGLCGLVLHNFLDFSLELPGVAVPVAALLGAVSARVLPSPKRPAKRWVGQAATVGLWSVGLVSALWLSFSKGELFRDLRSVSALVSSAEGSRRVAPEAAADTRLDALHSRHPANALLLAQQAYAAEQAKPPDLKRALSLANRVMYLAPTYAEGFFIAGRVLIKLGHRDQGLGLLRSAWALSSRPAPIVRQVVWYARNASEVRRSIPRVDENRDLLSVPALRRAVQALRSQGRRADASALLASVTSVQRYTTEDLLFLAQLAIEERSSIEARRFLSPLVSKEAAEPRALLLEARLLELDGRYEELLLRIEKMLASEAFERTDVLALRLRCESALSDFEAARRTLEALKQATPTTYASRAALALLEARLELAANRPASAVSVASAALEIAPEEHRLRLFRAALFEKLGRQPEAVRDLELVLRAKPGHAGARRSLARLKSRSATPGDALGTERLR